MWAVRKLLKKTIILKYLLMPINTYTYFEIGPLPLDFYYLKPCPLAEIKAECRGSAQLAECSPACELTFFTPSSQ